MQPKKVTYESRPARLDFLDGFRGYAIVMVVATHAMAYAKLEDSTISLLTFWVQAVAVPPFFLVDGFLFARNVGNCDFLFCGDYAVRSARRLLLPWVCFSFLYVVFRAAFEYVSHPTYTLVLDRTVGEVLAAIYYSSVSSQMYFLPALFIIRLLFGAARALGLLQPSRLVMYWLACVWVWQILPFSAEQGDKIDPVLSAIWGMQYYLLGMVLSIYDRPIAARTWAGVSIGFACLATVKILVPAWGVLSQYLYLVSLFFLFRGLGDRASSLSSLGRFTMGVYLIHAPVILKVVSSGAQVVFDQSGIGRYLLTTSIAVFASLGIARLCADVRWWKVMLGEEIGLATNRAR